MSQPRLTALTSTLLALLVLNLVVFDDLRTDADATVFETFTKPPHLASLLTGLLALVLLARRHARAVQVTLVVAWLQIAGFVFFHGIPVKIGSAKPYWGAEMGDLLQWAGFLLILACSGAIVATARQARTL